MIKQLGLLQSPESDLQHYMTTSETVSFDFDHLRDYLDGSTIRITVVLQIPEMRCLMASATADTSSALLACSSLDEAALKLQLPVLDLRAPLPLSPIEVAKPWGREIWFTGIEQRGVCTFDGISIPWLLACFCELLLGSATPPPLLLKILEPRSDEVLGDLYFEAHTEKTEVYVVTEIDPAAWPDGVGKIRFGFNPAKRSQYRNDIEFRNAYLGAVTSYRAIRYEIDRLQQQDSNEQALPPSLIEQEVAARQSMDTFTSLRDLRVGDVVQDCPISGGSAGATGQETMPMRGLARWRMPAARR